MVLASAGPRRLSIFLSLLTAVLIGAGCAGARPGAVLDARSAAPTGPTPTPQPALLPGGQPLAGGGPLLVALGDIDFSLLPTAARQRPWQEAVFDYVVGASASGELDQSGLASSWRSSPDMKAWTLRLRPGAAFHDGRGADSEDVRRTLQFHARPESAVTGGSELRENVASIETPDANTAVIWLKTPDFLFVYNRLSPRAYSVTGLLLPGRYLDAAGPEGFDAAPIGTGPYRHVRTIAGSRLVLAEGRHWLYGTPRHDALTFEGVPDEAGRMALLRSGKADVVAAGRAGASGLRQASYPVFVKAGAGTASILMHEQHLRYSRPGENPLSHVLVRQALGIAIDRDAIVETQFHGLAKPTASFPVASWDLTFQQRPPPSFDLERARGLLRQAGYPQGFDLDAVIVSYEGVPEGPEIMSAVLGSWARIGVKARPRPMIPQTYEKTWFAQGFGRPTVAGVLVFPNRFDAVALVGFTLPEVSSRLTEDPDLQRLAKEWKAARDPAEYVRAGRRLQGLATERQVYSTTLAEVGETYAVNSRVRRDWDLGKAPYSIAVGQLAAGPA